MIIEIQAIGFGGFYSGLFDVTENEIESINDECRNDENFKHLFFKDDWEFDEDYCQKVSEAYAEEYVSVINSILGLNMKYVSYELVSPREYNYTTDKIYIRVDIGDYKPFIEKLVEISSVKENYEAMRGIIYENHTSCSGFISLMENDIDKWIPIMRNSENARLDDIYASHFIAYLAKVVDEFDFKSIEERVYDDIICNTDWHLARSQTKEAKEEWELYQKYGHYYTDFAACNKLETRVVWINGGYKSLSNWEELKDDFMLIVKELEWKRRNESYPFLEGFGQELVQVNEDNKWWYDYCQESNY